MPARLSNREKELRGTLRKGRVTRAAKPPTVKVPPPPRDVPATERAIWRRLAGEVPSGIYSTSDGTAFRALVHAVAMAEAPPAGTTDSAQIHWARLAQSWLGKFGLTPLDRERVSVASETDDEARERAEDEFADGTLRVVK